MKLPLLNAYALMLPRIQAEEADLAVSVGAAGVGGFKTKEDHSRFMERLRRLARVPQRKARTLADIEAAGIPVHRVKRRRGGEQA